MSTTSTASATLTPSPLTHPLVTNDLHSIYHSTSSTTSSSTPSTRYSALLSVFASVYHAQPSFIVRAPACVSLLGSAEGTLACGLPVVTQALSAQDVLVAVRVLPDDVADESTMRTITLEHMDETRYERKVFSVPMMREPPVTPAGAAASTTPPLPSILIIPPPIASSSTLSQQDTAPSFIPSPPSILPADASASTTAVPQSQSSQATTNWTRYIQAGMKGMWQTELWRRQQQQQQQQQQRPRSATPSTTVTLTMPGLQILVEGSIPTSSGLGASSALVCASALMMSHIFNGGDGGGDGKKIVSDSTTVSASSSTLIQVAHGYSKLELAKLCASFEQQYLCNSNSHSSATTPAGYINPISIHHAVTSFLSNPGSALCISSASSSSASPSSSSSALNISHSFIKLPKNAMLLVVNTGARRPTSSLSSKRSINTTSNLHEVESTLAAHVLAKQLRMCCYAPDGMKQNGSSNGRPKSPRSPRSPPKSPPRHQRPGSASDASDHLPRLTLADVLQASGMTLVQMVEWLTNTGEKKVVSSGEEKENSSSSSTMTTAVTTMTTPPLHSPSYTLQELHNLFSSHSLSHFFSGWRPDLIAVLKEDGGSSGGRRGRGKTNVTAARGGKSPIPPPIASSSSNAIKTRLAFGRTLPSENNNNHGGESDDVQQNDSNANGAGMTDGGMMMDDEQQLPQQQQQLKGKMKNMTTSASSTTSKLPWQTQLNPNSLSSASGPASTLLDATQVTPYRTQGDPALYNLDVLTLRSSLKTDGRIQKEMNKIWMLLVGMQQAQPNGMSGGTPTTMALTIKSSPSSTSNNSLTYTTYSYLFQRLCKLFNPDLDFSEVYALVNEDWVRDVERTKEEVDGGGAGGTGKKKKEKKVKVNNNVPTSPTAFASASLATISYTTFCTSLFELIDLWCPDTSSSAYTNLLEQVYEMMTVRVISKGGSGDLGGNGMKKDSSTNSSRHSSNQQQQPLFALHSRALHIYTEALRMEEFKRVCKFKEGIIDSDKILQNQDADGSDDDDDDDDDSLSDSTSSLQFSQSRLSSLGLLLSASHISYSRSCSSEDTDSAASSLNTDADTLVNVCVQKAGAVGARLMDSGGYGGEEGKCVLALFDTSTFLPPSNQLTTPALTAAARSQALDHILDVLMREYYVKHKGYSSINSREKLSELVFVAQAGSAAAIYVP